MLAPCFSVDLCLLGNLSFLFRLMHPLCSRVVFHFGVVFYDCRGSDWCEVMHAAINVTPRDQWSPLSWAECRDSGDETGCYASCAYGGSRAAYVMGSSACCSLVGLVYVHPSCSVSIFDAPAKNEVWLYYAGAVCFSRFNFAFYHIFCYRAQSICVFLFSPFHNWSVFVVDVFRFLCFRVIIRTFDHCFIRMLI